MTALSQINWTACSCHELGCFFRVEGTRYLDFAHKLMKGKSQDIKFLMMLKTFVVANWCRRWAGLRCPVGSR